MTPIDTRQLNGLEWKQPSAFQREYELRTGDSVLGRMKFVRILGSLAEAEVSEQKWSLKRSGHFSTKATARQAGSEDNLVSYEPTWTGTKGTFRLGGGEVLDFQSANFWGSEWVLKSSAGEVLLRMHLKGALSTGSDVELSDSMRRRNDLALLLMMTWYVLVLHREDGAA